ncbi:MAG: N-acetylmuramoyl-L-alanine amidase [Elusimicrobiota bacterium]|jgi:N-acetylmuramoyl-L-alanine amidase|nr:N-acetylmuramoyl-L-alanine amidase [Elusimicrobiota bacterium]
MAKKSPPLTLVYPAERAVIPNGLPGIFLYGAAPAGARLLVNGVKAAVYKTGSWLVYIPVHTGNFDINLHCRAGGKTYTYKRSVFINEPPQPPAPRKTERLKAGPASRKIPSSQFTKAQPLKGLKVFLDPGHSFVPRHEHDGKTSPQGIYEHKINYQIALAARRKLRAMGAFVKLSKKYKEQMDLPTRTDKAHGWGADIFLSIHNNSWPDNVNPFRQKNGYGFYYYYRRSVPLARALERSYRRHIKELPDEGIKFADFSVTRNSPQIPAVLIESAYITLPEHEALLLKPAFIERLARAIAEGVLDFANPQAAANLIK